MELEPALRLFDEEAAAGFPVLRQIPAVHANWFVDFYGQLELSDRRAWRNLVAARLASRFPRGVRPEVAGQTAGWTPQQERLWMQLIVSLSEWHRAYRESSRAGCRRPIGREDPHLGGGPGNPLARARPPYSLDAFQLRLRETLRATRSVEIDQDVIKESYRWTWAEWQICLKVTYGLSFRPICHQTRMSSGPIVFEGLKFEYLAGCVMLGEWDMLVGGQRGGRCRSPGGDRRPNRGIRGGDEPALTAARVACGVAGVADFVRSATDFVHPPPVDGGGSAISAVVSGWHASR